MAAIGVSEGKAKVMVKMISKYNKLLCRKNMLENHLADRKFSAVCIPQSTFKKK